MIKEENGSGRLSPRKSLLVWVSGMFLGWGIAVVLVYQLIRTSDVAPTAPSQPVVATDMVTPGLAEIAPAAGTPAPAAAQTGRPDEMPSDTPGEPLPSPNER